MSKHQYVDIESYINRIQKGPCFICELVAGNPEYYHHVIYEDETAVVFLNKFPILYGYTLIAPREHREQATGDLTLDEYLALQRLIYRVAEALRQEVPTERMYILTLGSQQGNRHVHWHVAPLPPGVPFEKQQFEALTLENGVLELSDEEMSSLARRIRWRIENNMPNNPINTDNIETNKHPQESSALPVGSPVEPIEDIKSPSRTSLQGKYISLVPIDPERDAPELFAGAHGSEEKNKIWTYMGYGPFADVAAMRQWLEVQATSTDPLFFSVVDNASDRRIGMVSYLNIVPTMRRLELGHIWYSTDYQRTKVNTEAIYLMLSQTFDQLHYRRAEWKCDSLNARSRQAALRLGFSFEGLFKQHFIVKGRNRDTTWFAMTDHEWPGVKQNMERWLYEENGDLAGKPAVSLRQLNDKS